MAKNKKNTEEDEDIEFDENAIIEEEDQVSDDVTYSMGDIVVADDADPDDEDELILKSGVSSIQSDDDSDEDEDDVWLGDDYSLDDSDPFLDDALRDDEDDY